MPTSSGHSGGTAAAEHRHDVESRPNLAGVPVREEDIEPVQGIRRVALLFRGMAILLIALMVLQVSFGITSAVPISPGVVLADAVRLIIFAGLLWGAGDLAVLGVKSHYDLRASRILLARTAYMIREMGEKSGALRPSGSGSRADRAT